MINFIIFREIKSNLTIFWSYQRNNGLKIKNKTEEL